MKTRIVWYCPYLTAVLLVANGFYSLAMGNRFGARRGDDRYEAKYDLDGGGTIGFGGFLIFGQEFGRTVGS